MSFKLIASIRFFALQEKEVIATPFYNITNHKPIKELVIDQKFNALVGTLASKSFGENSIAYAVYEDNDDNETFKERMVTEFYERAPQIETYLLFLWFVKDNSVSFEHAYGQFSIADNYTYWTGHNIFSTCDGKYNNISFSTDEIKKSNDLLLAYTQNCMKQNDAQVNRIQLALNKANTSQFRPGVNPYKEENRVERALTFLSTARSSAHLPQKITHYMSILECLFSEKANQIVQKITVRTAGFLGAPAVKKTIKNAYDIRSRFVHGEKMKKNHQFISQVAIETDEVIRRVLIKVVTSDYDLFLQTDRKEFFKQLTAKY